MHEKNKKNFYPTETTYLEILDLAKKVYGLDGMNDYRPYKYKYFIIAWHTIEVDTPIHVHIAKDHEQVGCRYAKLRSS